MNHSVEVLTVGHSVHSYVRFAALLRQGGVSAVADVRSVPYSRHQAHFNREELRDSLKADGISYVFLGNELGGRPDKALLTEGVADYEKMAATETFKDGIMRVIQGANKHRIALMCSELHPLDCHRCLLVGRALKARGARVLHLLPDRPVATQEELEEELLRMTGRGSYDLLMTRDELIATAYRDRARKVAYSELSPPAANVALSQPL